MTAGVGTARATIHAVAETARPLADDAARLTDDAARIAAEAKFPHITVHGYVPPKVAAPISELKAETRARIQAQIELDRAVEVKRLTSLARVLGLEGRPGGSVPGLSLPDMYALQAFHGADRIRTLSSDVIEQTVTQARSVQRQDVAILVFDKPTRAVNMLRKELELRGATPRLIHTKGAKIVDGVAYDAKGKVIAAPEAATARGAKSFKMIQWAEDTGAFMMNDLAAIRATSSKSEYAALTEGLEGSMGGIGNITSVDGLVKAAEKYSYPLIVKVDVSSGGQGVFTALHEGDLHSIFDGVVKAGEKKPVFLAQPYFKPVSTGAKEGRYTFVNDVYDRPQLVAGYLREGKNTGDIRQNGPNGSTFTRIKVRENDPVISEEGVANAIQASERMPGKLRTFGGDNYHTEAHGDKTVELNPSSIPPDQDIEGLPRSEQVIPRMADLLIWGSAANRHIPH